VLILFVSFSVLFHNGAQNQELAAIRDHARLVSDLLGGGVIGYFQFSDYFSASPAATRLTGVAPDGTVLLDSKADADAMENHADRPEIIEALEAGTGEALRYSETLWNEMYYFAIRLSDGNILRVSRAVGGITDVLAVTLPVAIAMTVIIMVIAGFAARKLTERVIAPLEKIDFGGENTTVYEELLPYAKKIDRQRQEIREKMAELSQRAETIETITSNMKEGLILVNSDATTLTANYSARQIFGEHMENKNIMHIYRDSDFQNAVRQCLAGEHVELQSERGNRIYSVFLSPVNSGGAASGAVILFLDATERFRAEKQRREFSANVSHELKTPLTTISALSEMIGSGMAKDGDIKSFADRISEQAGRLLVLIDDIIRLSEFDEGSLTGDGAKQDDTVFDLWELTETVIGALREKAGNVEIRLFGERFEISANRRMIDELLYNLVDNGIKYNKDGGLVTVELMREKSGEKKGFCRITVSDTGIGIPAQHQDRVFERFYRVDKSRSKKTGGTGLGLSIVKHITEYCGGNVKLQSKEGMGTMVTCFLKDVR
jgi:two-component system phosphate regulon sensor histidine kinase PhoR